MGTGGNHRLLEQDKTNFRRNSVVECPSPRYSAFWSTHKYSPMRWPDTWADADSCIFFWPSRWAGHFGRYYNNGWRMCNTIYSTGNIIIYRNISVCVLKFCSIYKVRRCSIVILKMSWKIPRSWIRIVRETESVCTISWLNIISSTSDTFVQVDMLNIIQGAVAYK